jgi:hypothetical protein
MIARIARYPTSFVLFSLLRSAFAFDKEEAIEGPSYENQGEKEKVRTGTALHFILLVLLERRHGADYLTYQSLECSLHLYIYSCHRILQSCILNAPALVHNCTRSRPSTDARVQSPSATRRISCGQSG